MDQYEPPFTITNTMLRLVSEISENLGKIGVYRSLDNKPILRRNNRIKSVHSSVNLTAIE